MDWGAIIQLSLAIVGAALIMGGIVAYRRSKTTGVRAFAAAAVAAGAVMWVVVGLTVTVSSTGDGPPEPTVTKVEAIPTITEEGFMALLAVEDIRGVLKSDVELTAGLLDYKEMAGSVDPAQVENIDSWYGLGFEASGGFGGMTFTAMDFDSQASAQGHFETVKTETPGLQNMGSPIGDASVHVDVNAQGIGSMLVFIKGDKLVMLHTSQPDDREPLLSLEGLEELAGLVASRLAAA